MFEKYYGDTNYFYDGNSVQQTFDGGYILTGYEYNSQYNVYIVKTNSIGDTLWTRVFGGDNMIGFCVIQTSDSGFVICGYKNSTACDVNLIRLDANGNLLWNRLLGGSGCQWGQALEETFDGGFIIAGCQLYKTDSAGNLLWTKPLVAQAMGVHQTSDSGFVVAEKNTNAITLEKKDATGITQWTKNYAGTLFNPTCHTVEQIPGGGYILTGEDTGANHGALLIKTDMNGDTLWRKNIGGYSGTAVVQTTDGGYAVGGFIYDNTQDNIMLLVKTDVNGITQWTNTFGHAGDEWAMSMEQTADDGYILCGATSSFGSQLIYLVKTDSLGNSVLAIPEISSVTNFHVYPNPFSSIVNINIELGARTQNLHFEMFDVMGRKVKQFEFSSLNFSFDGADLSSGIYVWKVFSDNEIVCTGKAVKE